MNRRNYSGIVILSIIFFLSSLMVDAQTHAYIAKYKPLAQRLSSKYEIPTSLILAIAFVETGGGTSKNSKVLKNHFGITGKNHIGSKYRRFETVEQSFEEFCLMNTRKNYYKKLKGDLDHSKWLKAIAPVYTQHPSLWTKRVNLIIRKYKLSDL